jgi:hypothetical protein
MGDRHLVSVASKLVLVLALGVFLAACGGVSGPCDDSDPVGPCATSHSQTHGGA